MNFDNARGLKEPPGTILTDPSAFFNESVGFHVKALAIIPPKPVLRAELF
jgi:hypothetical protein